MGYTTPFHARRQFLIRDHYIANIYKTKCARVFNVCCVCAMPRRTQCIVIYLFAHCMRIVWLNKRMKLYFDICTRQCVFLLCMAHSYVSHWTSAHGSSAPYSLWPLAFVCAVPCVCLYRVVSPSCMCVVRLVLHFYRLMFA